MAENERTNIRQRQAEGITAAKARGVRFGAPKALLEGFYSAYQWWKTGKITGTAVAKECGVLLVIFRYQAESYKKLNYHKKANFTERYTLFTEFTENFSSENEDKNLENEREIR